MAPEFELNINGETRNVTVAADTPLIYVLRNELGLKGTRFGCGLEQCGCCMVLVDGEPVYSCTRAIDSVAASAVVTVEGLGSETAMHPLQQAFIDEQAAQCGYCASGMIMAAADLLNRNPQPQEADVRAALANNLCRCGTHNRIIRAVLRAAQGAA